MKNLVVFLVGVLLLGTSGPAHRNVLSAQEPDSSFVLLAIPGPNGVCAGVKKMDHPEMKQKFGLIDSYMYVLNEGGTRQRLVTVMRDSLNNDVSINDMVSISDSSGRKASDSLLVIRSDGGFQGMRPPTVLVENGVVVRPAQLPTFTPVTTQEMARARELGDWVYRHCRTTR